jgi:geranylgeranyl diphosphate/geranylgeranyl-bacteriochlorophyllide a reductase
MKCDFDIGIVGAGPAGSWAAYRLARAGARVALIDGSHPREKPCGGGVTGRALALVRDAIDPAAVGGVPIDTATFVCGPHAATVKLDDAGDQERALVVAARRDFDAALLRAAVGAGATLVARRATDVARANGGWTIATASAPVSCTRLVGADGANSLVRRRVSAPFERRDLSIASGFFIHGVSSREIDVVFETDPPGYLWSFPRPDHLAVGVGAQADESSSAQLFALASKWIARHVVGGNPRLERYSWPIPSLGREALGRERSAGDRWMLVGDAAGLVDPITREGIYFALASGDAAAASLLSADAERAYLRYLGEHIHPELARAARLKARFFQPRFTALMIRSLQRSRRIRGVMADLVAGRQTYRGLKRRLLRTLDVRSMVELLRS